MNEFKKHVVDITRSNFLLGLMDTYKAMLSLVTTGQMMRKRWYMWVVMHMQEGRLLN